MTTATPAAAAKATNGGAPRPLMEVRNLVKHFPITRGIIFQRQVGAVKAVDDISFKIYPGETFGLVGESGSGKSTTGRAVLQLHRPSSGEVLFDETNLVALGEGAMRRQRRKLQMIFQDPYASLNPRMTIGQIVAEPLGIHKLHPGKGAQRERTEALLQEVGINPALVNRYPHEFSGGQRQRIGIARALAAEPSFIVCDEPILALDVSIQAQVVNLLQDLQDRLGLTYLFIAHDLSMIRHLCQRVAVMYRGRIVELAETDELYRNPQHPYTKVLLSAVPIPDPDIEQMRRHQIMDPTFDYSEQDSKMVEVTPGHWVAASRV